MRRPITALTTWGFTAITAIGGCGDQEKDAPGRDSEVDSTLESIDSETASDSDAAPNTVCVDSISGRVRIENADPVPVAVIVCIGVCFAPISTDADGQFEWHHPIGGDIDCIPYNFEETPLHIELRVSSRPEAFAEYAFLTVPTQEEVSDDGPDDYDLDMGALTLYALPEETARYTPSTGASVSLFGLTGEIPADGLVKSDGDQSLPVEHAQEIQVLSVPSDAWTPPFASEPLSALYFIGPRWARLSGEGVSFVMAAPDGLDEGDEVPIYLLGSYASEWGDLEVSDRPDFIYLDGEGRCVSDNGDEGLIRVPDGVFQECGTVQVINGKIETPPIPRLTWIGVGR